MRDKIIQALSFLVGAVTLSATVSILFNRDRPLIDILVSLALTFLAIHPAFGFNIPILLKLIEEPVRVGMAVPEPELSQPPAVTFHKPDHLIEHYASLEKRFLALADEQSEMWNVILTQERGNYCCSVQKRSGHDFFFRIVVDFEATKEETFDLLADIAKRKDWDELTEKCGILERISLISSYQVYSYLTAVHADKNFMAQFLPRLPRYELH